MSPFLHARFAFVANNCYAQTLLMQKREVLVEFFFLVKKVLVEFGFRICVYFFFWVTLCVCSSELLEQFLSKKKKKRIVSQLILLKHRYNVCSSGSPEMLRYKPKAQPLERRCKPKTSTRPYHLTQKKTRPYHQINGTINHIMYLDQK